MSDAITSTSLVQFLSIIAAAGPDGYYFERGPNARRIGYTYKTKPRWWQGSKTREFGWRRFTAHFQEALDDGLITKSDYRGPPPNEDRVYPVMVHLTEAGQDKIRRFDRRLPFTQS